MVDTYQVVITGLSGEFSKNQVLINLASLFKITVDKLPDIFSQSKYVVKKNIDFDTAEKYKSALQNQGCICKIEQIAVDTAIEKFSSKTTTLESNEISVSASENINNADDNKACSACGYRLSNAAKFCFSCGESQAPNKKVRGCPR